MAVSQVLSVTEVSGSVNTTANTSQVRILWQSTQTGDSWNGYTRTAKYYVSINGGAETEYSVAYTLPLNSTTTIVDKTITVTHNNDGTGSVRVRTWMDTSISAGVVEKSSTLTLTTIPRATTLDSLSCSSNYFTGTLTYKYTPKTPNYYNVCSIYLNINGTLSVVKTINIGTKTASQKTATITLSESELSTIYNKIPNGTNGVLRFTLYTYTNSGSSGAVIGSGQYKEITLSIPNDATTQPTVSMSLSPSNDLPSPYNGLYIQGLSKVKATLDPTAKYGATIVSSSITVSGNTYASPYESGILAQSGTISVKATTKDSRGFYGTYYKDIEVLPYSNPYLRAYSEQSSIIATRCDASGNLTNDDASKMTCLKIKAKVVYSKLISGGVQNNYGSIKYRYRKEGESYPKDWTTIHDSETDINHSDEVIVGPLLIGKLDIKSNYQVQIIATDKLFESAPITIAIPSDAVYMDRPAGGKSMGLGGYAQGNGNLDIYWKTKARGGISLVDSTGSETPIVASALLNPHDQLPTGWNPDNLANGVYAVSGSKPLMVGTNVIMRNGVLIQMSAYEGGDVKIQLALTSDEDKNPYYRVHWYGSWGNWRSFKL